MRVLIITFGYPPVVGGTETAVYQTALGLREAGHTPYVLCIQRGDSPCDTEDIHEGVPVRRVKYARLLAGLSHFRFTRVMWRVLPSVIERFKPDVIWSWLMGFGIGLARRDYGVPFIHIPASAYTVGFRGILRGLAFTPGNLPSIVKLRILEKLSIGWEREILARCHRTVVFSDNVQRQLISLYPDFADKVVVVPPGVDINRFPAIKRQHAEDWLRETWKIPKNRKLILYVGRLEPDKHVHHLIEMMSELRSGKKDSCETAHLILVGDGSHANWLKRRADELWVSDSVTFAGYQKDELGRYYTGAWVHVLPTLVESFGLVLVEASLCRTPSIAFRPDGDYVLTAADEIVNHGETGLLVDDPSPSGLAESLRQSFEWNDETRDRMGIAAREWILSEYRRDNFVDTVVNLSAR